MTSADFSQFVVTARLLFFLKSRLRDLPSYGRTLSGLYPLGLLSAVRIVIGLLLLMQHYPCLPAFYQVLVHRANRLPPASFRFRLTADTLAFGCNLPTIRAVWGLAPVRMRSCWANIKKAAIFWLPYSIQVGLLIVNIHLLIMHLIRITICEVYRSCSRILCCRPGPR